MENKNYEEEYSLLEIAKYNLKHWVILLICALVVGLAAGAYGYKNTKPSVVYYEELQQVNGAFYISQYNDSSITERMYDLQQMALSNGAYETFLRETGHNMTYQEYLKMFGYSNSVVTSILNLYIPYPETYGDVKVETEADAKQLMQELLDSQKKLYDEYAGKDAVSILSEPYVTSYTQASAETATTTKDLVSATVKGGLAGIFLGLLLGILVVSVVYLIGTVAKTAKEIEQKLKAPVVAFVHKKDRAEEFKKAFLFLEKENAAHKSIAYLPYHAKNADGAYDLAKAYASMEYNTLLLNLAADAEDADAGFSEYLYGKASADKIKSEKFEDEVTVISRKVSVEENRELMSSKVLKIFIREMEEKYDRVIVNTPDLMFSSDAYGIIPVCDQILIGCKRREVTGTDLYEIENTMANSEIKIDGVIIYGN